MSEALPIIDISPFRLGGPEAGSVVARVRAAAEGTGFFLVTGHGVSVPATRALYDKARAFFDLPPQERARQPQGGDLLGGVAFSPLKSEALAATLGIKTPGDMKQSLNFGPRLAGAVWPSAVDGLEQAFVDYFREMEGLAQVLRRIFCAAIGLPPDYFEADFEAHLSALRVIDYPEQTAAPEPGQLRAGVHTDYGFMTILRSEASPGGLQVQDLGGNWLDAPSVEGAYVINIGDAFMRWTNDRWKSTAHRVVNPPAGAGVPTRRQSIPFFVNPSKTTMIRCLEPFMAEGPRHAPISFGDYIALKTQQAFAAGRG